MQIFTVDNNSDIKELCKKNKIKIKDIKLSVHLLVDL